MKLALALSLCLLLAAATAASAQDGPAGPAPTPARPRCETPEALVAAYLACYDPQTERFSQVALVDLYSEDSLFLLFPSLSRMTERAVGQGPEAPARREALAGILTRHGLDPATKPLEGGAELSAEDRRELFFDPERSLRHLRVVFKAVASPRQLLRELFAFCAEAQRSPDPRPLEVTALVVRGAHARGRLTQERSDAQGLKRITAQPFHLVLEEGAWRCDLLGLAKELVARMPPRPQGSPQPPRAPQPSPSPQQTPRGQD